MTLANPLGLLLGLLAIPIVLLHILKPRREQIEVSSTYLWRDLATPVSAAAPWQKLRPSILLALQLLAVGLLALAVARPALVEPAPLSPHTVFIIDGSGSMAAADGSDEVLPDRLDGTRLAAARDKARELYAQLPEDGLASIVFASPRPQVLLTTSPNEDSFDRALDRLPAPGGAANFAAAFNLAESLETPGTPIGFVLLSDGGLTDEQQSRIPVDTRWEKIGRFGTNRAITSLIVEPRGTGLHAIVTVENTGGPRATQELRIDVDGGTEVRETVVLAEGETVVFETDLPAGARIEAFLDGEDLLAADNRAFAVASQRRDLEILVAGPANPFLDQLLSVIPGLTVDRSELPSAGDGYDLVIYDRVAVPESPGAPFIAIAPRTSFGDITITGEVENPVPTLVRTDRALLDGLDFSEVAIALAQQVDPGTNDVLIGAEGAPLLLTGDLGGRRFAHLTFALGDSNFPVQIAFPILFDRLIGDLAGAAQAPTAITVGQPIPVDGSALNLVVSPSGNRLEIPPGSARPRATRTGFWTVIDAEANERDLAVNEDPRESDTAPADALLVETSNSEDRASRIADGLIDKLWWVALPLLLVLVLEFIWARRRLGVARKQWRWAVALRVLVALLVLGALLGFAIPRPANDVATVFLIDGSDSVGPAGRTAAVEWVRAALAEQPDGARSAVAVFGDEARLELTLKIENTLGVPAVEIDASQTNLANALRLGGAVLPTDSRRRIVLLSDGRATAGDVVEEAQLLAADGVQVDIHTLTTEPGADVAVAALDAPGLVREGEQIVIDASVVATRATTAVLTLLEDGEVVDTVSADLEAGTNTVRFEREAGVSGLVRYEVQVRAAGDGVPQNDRAFAAIPVEGPARVLLVEGRSGSADTLATALEAGGLLIDRVRANQFPPVDELAQYSSTILVDVDITTMAPSQVAALGTATRDLGKGLVTIGGVQSYGLGGYLGSEFEELLPVVSEVLDPQRRQSVAQVLAVDTSGSMGACHCAEEGPGAIPGNQRDGGVNKTDIARNAAARAIEALNSTDEVGVLAFNSRENWVIDLQQVPAADVVSGELATLQPSGGTDISQTLMTAAEALRTSNASLKHIILFTDGFTEGNTIDGLAEEAAALAAEGITVSVVATGEGASKELRDIAENGDGRFYPGRDLERIPQIIMEEAIIASRDFVNEGSFLPVVTSNDRVVSELDATPPLLGYVATTSKPTASTLLRIGPDADPLLATWQIGLGRATSWTSDGGDRWGQLWADWDGFVDFWSTLVKDTFAAGEGAGAVRARVEDGVLKVIVEGEDAFGEGAEATARVSSPDGSTAEIPLRREAGNRYVGELPVDGKGTYAVGASVVDGDETLTGTSLANLSFSAEYLPGEADPEEMASISAITAGRGEIEPAMAFDRDGLPSGESRFELGRWFLLAAALLWPIAVALSRLSLRTSAVGQSAGRVGDWMRDRIPERPGADLTPTPGGEGAPSEPAQPTQPKKTTRKPKREKRPKKPVVVVEDAPPPQSETLGRLLDRKRGTANPPDE